jgi:breakpoint cluster region protein
MDCTLISSQKYNLIFFCFSIDGIPRIVVKCIEVVERDGLTETGIYRVCCVASDLQKLRHEFDKNSHRGEDILLQKNVHVAANLLKLFFRELPEPLFTSTLYKQFLNAIQLTDIDNQRIMLLQTFELLNINNRKILFYLFDHLIRVSQYSNVNMMHLDNLAVVFGPTLMRPSKLILPTSYSGSNTTNGQTDLDQMSSELQGSMYQCQVVLACLKLRRDGILK